MRQLKTRWSDKIDREHVLEEYPRPLMRRNSYINLNGMWDYAITGENRMPEKYDGAICVPFSPESQLSGVKRQLKPREYLWYRRRLPQHMRPEEGRRWLLNFGAVDQYAEVYVNGTLVKKHLGGYLPFTADITEALCEDGNELAVLARDYSDASYYSRGKQKLKRGGMFYTAQSGIWQTVWAEQVPDNYITGISSTPVYDSGCLRITIEARRSETVEVTVSSGEMQPVQVGGRSGHPVDIPLKEMHSWSPEDPFLYDIEVTMGEDQIVSYAAMRKIEVKKDGHGIPRIWIRVTGRKACIRLPATMR